MSCSSNTFFQSHDPGVNPVLPELLDPVEALCERAGAEILEIFSASMKVKEKADLSPVTAADLAAHRILADGLTQLLDLPVLSEEGELPSFDQRRQWQRYWLIDPLDGTRQFVRGSSDFSVNVALIDRGKPVLGFVHLPAHDRAYRAALGGGAMVRNASHPWRSMAPRPAQQPLRICVSSSRGGERQGTLVDRLAPAVLDLKGSSWKSCLVAEGLADLYPRFGPTCEWDTAAAQCIVEEAGGFLTDFDLKPLLYNQHNSIINRDFLVFGDPATGERVQRLMSVSQ